MLPHHTNTAAQISTTYEENVYTGLSENELRPIHNSTGVGFKEMSPYTGRPRGP